MSLSNRRFYVAGAVALVLFFASQACSLKPGACIRMSDCDDGLSCVEGTCTASSASAVTSDVDGSAAVATASDASTD